MPGHPSVFWFEQEAIMLCFYVDDLLLSGPAGKHDEIWAKLAKHINIEEPEDLDRVRFAVVPMLR